MTLTRQAFSRFALALAAALAAGGASALHDPLPELAVKQLAAYLPAAVVPLPKKSAPKLYSLYSEDRMLPDRRNSIDPSKGPFALAAVTEDGKGVRLDVPGQTKESFTNLLFHAEDVFGKVKWKIERYEAPSMLLAYFPGVGKQENLLMGAVERGTVCASLGTVQGAKGPDRLLMIRKTSKAGGIQCKYSIVLAREAPPVSTQAEYDARAKQLFSERAYSQGAAWGKMHPAILTNEGAYECAGMCSDFVKYMYDDSFMRGGERYTDVNEIRTGDVIYFKSHYVSVVYRRGDTLQTIEGNMNARINKSVSTYRMSGGKLYHGKRQVEFVRGKHYWPAGGGKEK